MSSSAANSGATDRRQTRFEQSVALLLNLWPALSLAVQNNWGGPDSRDKRAWFAGAVVDLFPPLISASGSSQTSTQASNNPSTARLNGVPSDDEPDEEDVETVLLQVMLDEFEVNVDDDSAYEVAQNIVTIRGQCARGKFEEVEALQARWEKKGGKSTDGLFRKGEDQDNDTDWDSDEDGEDEESDEDMGEAPPLAQVKREKAAPEVDDDGFTKVARKR